MAIFASISTSLKLLNFDQGYKVKRPKPKQRTKPIVTVLKWFAILTGCLFVFAVILVMIIFFSINSINSNNRKRAEQAYLAAREKCGAEPIAIVDNSQTDFDNVTTTSLIVYQPSDKDYNENKAITSNAILGSVKVAYYTCNLDQVISELPPQYDVNQFYNTESLPTSFQTARINQVIKRIKAENLSVYAPSGQLPGLTLSSKTATYSSSRLDYSYLYTGPNNPTTDPLKLVCTLNLLKNSDGSPIQYADPPTAESPVLYKGPPDRLNNEWTITFKQTTCTFDDNDAEISQAIGNAFMNNLVPSDPNSLSGYTLSYSF